MLTHSCALPCTGRGLMKHPFSALSRHISVSLLSKCHARDSHEPDTRHNGRHLVERRARQPAEEPHPVSGVFAQPLKQRDSVRGGLERVARVSADPERVLEVEEQKPHSAVFVPRDDGFDIERRNGRRVALLVLEVRAEAAREEGRDEGLCGLCHDVPVQVLQGGASEVKLKLQNVRHVHLPARKRLLVAHC